MPLLAIDLELGSMDIPALSKELHRFVVHRCEAPGFYVLNYTIERNAVAERASDLAMFYAECTRAMCEYVHAGSVLIHVTRVLRFADRNRLDRAHPPCPRPEWRSGLLLAEDRLGLLARPGTLYRTHFCRRASL